MFYIAIRKAVEFAEDSKTQGWLDLQAHQISDKAEKHGKLKTDLSSELISALEKSEISVDEGYCNFKKLCYIITFKISN